LLFFFSIDSLIFFLSAGLIHIARTKIQKLTGGDEDLIKCSPSLLIPQPLIEKKQKHFASLVVLVEHQNSKVKLKLSSVCSVDDLVSKVATDLKIDSNFSFDYWNDFTGEFNALKTLNDLLPDEKVKLRIVQTTFNV